MIKMALTRRAGELIEGALADKSKKSGISVDTLRKVYNRGVAAWKTGHRPGTTPQQWGYARVNAFIVKKKKSVPPTRRDTEFTGILVSPMNTTLGVTQEKLHKGLKMLSDLSVRPPIRGK